jgi:hypothetical protein
MISLLLFNKKVNVHWLRSSILLYFIANGTSIVGKQPPLDNNCESHNPKSEITLSDTVILLSIIRKITIILFIIFVSSSGGAQCAFRHCQRS